MKRLGVRANLSRLLVWWRLRSGEPIAEQFLGLATLVIGGGLVTMDSLWSLPSLSLPDQVGTWGEWVGALANVLVGVIALVIAIWGNLIQRYLAGPKLIVVATKNLPDCVTVPLTGTDPGTGIVITCMTCYIRFRVENRSRTPAHNVHVYAAKLERFENGEWGHVIQFAPLHLAWSDIGAAPKEYALRLNFPTIGGLTSKHCDLARVLDPAMRYRFGNAEPKNASRQRPYLEFETIVK